MISTLRNPSRRGAGRTETRVIRGACPHDCPDTCAVLTEVRSGRAVSIVGDPTHPITQGWLCAKVRPYLDRVYHPDRLRYPMRRIGGKGSDRWARISWDDAVDEIVERWQRIIAEYGAAAILPYSFSGTLGLVQNTATVARLWNRMGASGLERSICGAAAELAVTLTYGGRMAPAMEDVLESRLIIIWGHNPASTSPHFMPFLRQAQRRGCRVVVIDPRRTTTARSADLHLQPHPGTDAALALGLMQVIFSEHLYDEPWLEEHAAGWWDLRDRAEAFPPERVARITGVDAGFIVDLAREYATTKPAMLKTSDGINRHGNGGQTMRALACLPAVAGQVGLRGGGLFYSTSDYIRWDGEAVGHASECPPVPRIVNMNRIGAALTGEATDPPIKSLYVFNANPAASSPNQNLIRRGLAREDLFTVVHDLFLTDTARYADIVLPATSQLEQVDLHKGYGHRYLQYNLQAIEPLGEAMSNWDVMRLLAAGLGYEEPWVQQPAGEVIEEIFEATKRTCRWLDGITLDQLREEGTVPINAQVEAVVPFADGVFPTPSGKIELYSRQAAELGVDPLPDWEPPAEYADHNWDRPGDQLALISGAAHHFVSSSLANVPKLLGREGEPLVEINPADAASRGITNGDDVIIENERGACRLRAVVTEDVPAGVLVSPKGHWASLSPDANNVNQVTSDALADLAGQSTFHSTLVRLRRISPEE